MMAVVYKTPVKSKSRPSTRELPPPVKIDPETDPIDNLVDHTETQHVVDVFLTETPAGFHDDMEEDGGSHCSSYNEPVDCGVLENESDSHFPSDLAYETVRREVMDTRHPDIQTRTQSEGEVVCDIMEDKGWDTDLENDDTSSTYDSSGRTAYIDACRRQGVVAASYFIRHMNDVQLEMRHHGLGPSGAKALAISLVSNTTVLTLDLSDNWMGPTGGTAVCDMMKENCYITELNLSENKLGTSCALILADIMVNSNTLTRISLSGNEFDDSAAETFAEAIMNTSKIEYLDLSHNSFGETAGEILGPAISENSSIKHLDISWNCIRRKGAVALANGIKNNIFMKRINLSWNGCGTEGAIAIGDALRNNSVLEEIDLANNRINTEGAVLVGKGLSVNESLKVFKMGLNPMQSAGCYAILAAILKNPNMILEAVDFQGVLVNKDYIEIETQCKEQFPELKISHGGFHEAKKRVVNIHPMLKLQQYIEKQNLRLIEFFLKFDKDGSMSVTREEFAEGIVENNVPLTRDEVTVLLNELDKDGDGEIDFSELVMGNHEFKEQQEEQEA